MKGGDFFGNIEERLSASQQVGCFLRFRPDLFNGESKMLEDFWIE